MVHNLKDFLKRKGEDINRVKKQPLIAGALLGKPQLLFLDEAIEGIEQKKFLILKKQSIK